MASQEEPVGQSESPAEQVNDLFDSSELAEAIAAGEFRHFLDHAPIAIVIFKLLRGDQRVVYANKTFEALFGQSCENLRGRGWSVFNGLIHEDNPELPLSKAV